MTLTFVIKMFVYINGWFFFSSTTVLVLKFTGVEFVLPGEFTTN